MLWLADLEAARARLDKAADRIVAQDKRLPEGAPVRLSGASVTALLESFLDLGAVAEEILSCAPCPRPSTGACRSAWSSWR